MVRQSSKQANPTSSRAVCNLPRLGGAHRYETSPHESFTDPPHNTLCLIPSGWENLHCLDVPSRKQISQVCVEAVWVRGGELFLPISPLSPPASPSAKSAKNQPRVSPGNLTYKRLPEPLRTRGKSNRGRPAHRGHGILGGGWVLTVNGSPDRIEHLAVGIPPDVLRAGNSTDGCSFEPELLA